MPEKRESIIQVCKRTLDPFPACRRYDPVHLVNHRLQGRGNCRFLGIYRLAVITYGIPEIIGRPMPGSVIPPELEKLCLVNNAGYPVKIRLVQGNFHAGGFPGDDTNPVIKNNQSVIHAGYPARAVVINKYRRRSGT